MAEIQRLISDVLMNDGTRIDGVTVTLLDKVRYSDAARKRKWGPSHEEPELYAYYGTWSALQRTGRFPGTWEAFLSECETVQPREQAETVDPTQTATPDD